MHGTRLGVWSLAVCAACSLPRDPQGTLGRVTGGTLRVGVVDAPPWAVARQPHAPGGVEVALVEGLAEQLGATIVWSPGGETRLMAGLQDGTLDLVIGGIVQDSPYAERVGTTRVYLECDDDKHVFAGPPGENRWLMTVEAFLADAAPTCEAGR